MPDLLIRVATPSTLRRLVQCPSRLCAPVRCYHEASARSHPSVADSLLQSHTSLNEDGVLSKARKHGFRDLPVSPLLGKREKKQGQMKQPIVGMSSTEDLVEFQNEFEDNVHAHALATPIRQCKLTWIQLPSHFLVPFSTVIERIPPASEGRRPGIRATLQPGRPSEMTGECLPGPSYVLNRKDVVRHLSRKSTWVSLISERLRIAIGKRAGRKPNGRFMVQELYDWEDQVEAVEIYLERRVKAALLEAFKVKVGEEESPANRSQQPAFALRYAAPADGVAEPGPELDSSIMAYDLPSLLSPETLEALDGGLVHVAKSPAARRAQLALEKLKAYKESDSPIKIKKGAPGGTGPSEQHVTEEADT